MRRYAPLSDLARLVIMSSRAHRCRYGCFFLVILLQHRGHVLPAGALSNRHVAALTAKPGSHWAKFSAQPAWLQFRFPKPADAASAEFRFEIDDRCERAARYNAHLAPPSA